ncbi:MBL fold metallo-hydrolase [Kushneria indalinina]|uniref:Glyoxylase-like metal-dependent hydrolase (Beta-lactamase superfamily II) n=1 Tax=Kushneria indalinina DSM 14324 TaxID=1122140 RepID=A0A3D9DSX8_9GAMM|nr:MBL fold metallo-hydrolase [Kushneria indalinina]REC93842.1 glyoxylase-like metal-dependent hydrolase (beta-lactamase superfamily II) [Kushneria indalinina DSM 14324]
MLKKGVLCANCGVQFEESEHSPARCPICEDEREFVPVQGQRWTSPEALVAQHANVFEQLTPGLLSLRTTPSFGIGQRALLLQTPHGNVLWDCISLLDDATVQIIEGLGGLAAIAISHPHYYSTMASWAEAFDCPITLHGDDREWVMQPSERLSFWQGDRLEVLPGVTLHRLGGHFPGACVLHDAERGLLLGGDTLLVTPDRLASFMWSWPNNIPLPAARVKAMGETLETLEFDALYCAFRGSEIVEGAGKAVRYSVARYCRALE